MRTAVAWPEGEAAFTFTLAEEDPGRMDHATMTGRTMRIRFPLPLERDQVHPDLEALAAVLAAARYAGPRFVVERPISQVMQDAVRECFELEIGPVDPALHARARPLDGVPALAFSGGADSVAAATMLPPDTVLGFLRRIDPVDRPPANMVYRDDAALHACRSLQEHGREVHIFESDLEHLRDPIGFPTDWANGIGLLLLADHLRFRSIAWGVVAESAYRIGHLAYADWAVRGEKWIGLFAAAGLTLDAPLAGVSEVGTALIDRQSPYRSVIQSCIRGSIGAPCSNCWKCFRKSLLDAAISGNWPSESELDRLFAIREVDEKLVKLPIPHENVLAWIASRYEGSHPKMRLLRERTVVPGETYTWLEHWYPPAASHIDPAHREYVTDGLDRELGRMPGPEEASFRGFTLAAWIAEPATLRVAAELVGHRIDETSEERALRRQAARRAALAAAPVTVPGRAATPPGSQAQVRISKDDVPRKRPWLLRRARKGLRRLLGRQGDGHPKNP